MFDVITSYITPINWHLIHDICVYESYKVCVSTFHVEQSLMRNGLLLVVTSILNSPWVSAGLKERSDEVLKENTFTTSATSADPPFLFLVHVLPKHLDTTTGFKNTGLH